MMGRKTAVLAVSELASVLLVSVLLALFARTWLVQGYAIPSESMEPGLRPGDHVLVNKFIYGGSFLGQRPVGRGDVVIFDRPEDGTRVIKRCVAVAGDTVELRDKQLYINQQPVDESTYAQHSDAHTYPSSDLLDVDLRWRDNLAPLELTEGQLFMLGDHRDVSLDSRAWGPVDRNRVVGHAIFVYWSSSSDSSGMRMVR